VSTAVLSLGSNLGDRAAHLRAAVAGFAGAADTEVLAVSPVYRTAPWGGVEQPEFLNAVLLARSATLDEWGWLRRGQRLEQRAGRVREVRWGPRTLDVDVVSVTRADGTVVRSADPELLLPHPGTAQRNTVLRPWLDVDPDASLPGLPPLAGLLAELGTGGMWRTDLRLDRPGGEGAR
jgi:2-amino-4-hydroxy-6-hydroxymethyldihydropteridine diphosphokinase